MPGGPGPASLTGRARGWRLDLVMAAGLAAGALAFTPETHGLSGRWSLSFLVVGCCGAVVMRRRWPLAASAVAAGAFVAPAVTGHTQVFTGGLDIFIWAPFLLAYELGTSERMLAGLAGAALMAIGLQVGTQAFNPFVEMISFGPWAAGRIVRSRRRLLDQLEARNLELETERRRFADESVRYERARIARELHDIVAHCLCVMVVQAGAGQRLGSDTGLVRDALDSIAEAAREAQAEVGRLVELLAGEPLAVTASSDLVLVDELARRARRAGLDVSCRWIGDCRRVGPAASEACYRIVQEALTNALKHSPGAPVRITVSETGDRVEVEVTNGPSRGPSPGLDQFGAGRGLAGMRERVAVAGGTLTAAATMAGGWRVAALLPIDEGGPARAPCSGRSQGAWQ